MDEYHLWYFVSFDLICGINFRLLILFFSMFDKVSILLGPAIMGTKKSLLRWHVSNWNFQFHFFVLALEL